MSTDTTAPLALGLTPVVETPAPTTTTAPSATKLVLAKPDTKLATIGAAMTGLQYYNSKGELTTLGATSTTVTIKAFVAKQLKVKTTVLTGLKAWELYNCYVNGKIVVDIDTLAKRVAENQKTAAETKARIEERNITQLGLFDAGIGALFVGQIDKQLASHGLDRFTPEHMDLVDSMLQASKRSAA